MRNPLLLGRLCGESPESASERSKTVEVASIEIQYTSGAVGSVKAQIFASDDDEDRGGFVLRLTINDGGCSFAPLAVHTSEGLDLHLAGEAEGRAVLAALGGLIAAQEDSLLPRAVR